jgi:hypothetical protein
MALTMDPIKQLLLPYERRPLSPSPMRLKRPRAMTGRWKACLSICIATALATVVPSPCRAIDYQPFDWIPAAPGTNVVMGFYDFGAHNEFNSTISGTAKSNTNLDTHIGIARYLHYSEIF